MPNEVDPDEVDPDEVDPLVHDNTFIEYGVVITEPTTGYKSEIWLGRTIDARINAIAEERFASHAYKVDAVQRTVTTYRRIPIQVVLVE